MDQIPELRVSKDELSEAESALIAGKERPSIEEQALFAWLFSDLFGAGVPILQALQTTYGFCKNPWIRLAIARMRALHREHKCYTLALSPSTLAIGLDMDLLQAVSDGEHGGELDHELRRYAAKKLSGSRATLAGFLGRSQDAIVFFDSIDAALKNESSVEEGVKAATQTLSAEGARVASEILADLEDNTSLGQSISDRTCAALTFDRVALDMTIAGDIGDILPALVGRISEQSRQLDE